MDPAWRRWLRLEGGMLLLAAVAAYPLTGGSWGRFALLFLVPDLSFAGYLGGPRLGAWAYNLLHATILPWALLVAAHLLEHPALASVAVIWLAHIGFDRLLGYGLKSATAFTETHLGRIGRAAKGEQ